jgi:GT2 family glycosyltransferase
MTCIDVLVPTRGRAAALAVTLAALIGQTWKDFRVIASDQTEELDAAAVGEVQAVVRVLELLGHPVTIEKHVPPRGLAEQQQFLLDCCTAPYALFLDDDIIVEPDLLERLLRALRREHCGFVGSAMIGLKYRYVVRPEEEAIDFWSGPVQPEVVRPGGRHWARHRLHNACNLLHVQQRLGLTPANERLYKIAWVAGCVLYDAAKLRAAGGFSFWRELPAAHCGEDVLAELRVMARFGGCGLAPSGAYHQDLPTTVPDRRYDAPWLLDLGV